MSTTEASKQPSPAPQPQHKPTPATTSQTKADPKPMDFNAPAETAQPQPNPGAAEAVPGSQTAEEPKRRGRPPRDPNAAGTSPVARAEAVVKAVEEMGMGELLKAKEKAVADLAKAHELTTTALPRLLEIAAAIKAKLA